MAMNTSKTLEFRKLAAAACVAAATFAVCAGGEPQRDWSEMFLASSPSLAPDGLFFAFEWNGRIWRASPDGGVAQPLDFIVVGMEFQTCFRVHGIDYEVRMYVVTVDVSSDQHLIAREVFFSEPQSDFVSSLGCNRLVRMKGLHDVVILSAACLAVLQLGIDHLIERRLRHTVDSGDELSSVVHGFLVLHTVVKQPPQALTGLRFLPRNDRNNRYATHLFLSNSSVSVRLSAAYSLVNCSRFTLEIFPMLLRTVSLLRFLPIAFC